MRSMYCLSAKEQISRRIRHENQRHHRTARRIPGVDRDSRACQQLVQLITLLRNGLKLFNR